MTFVVKNLHKTLFFFTKPAILIYNQMPLPFFCSRSGELRKTAFWRKEKKNNTKLKEILYDTNLLLEVSGMSRYWTGLKETRHNQFRVANLSKIKTNTVICNLNVSLKPKITLTIESFFDWKGNVCFIYAKFAGNFKFVLLATNGICIKHGSRADEGFVVCKSPLLFFWLVFQHK